MALRNLLKRSGPRPLPLLIHQPAKALEAASELQQYIDTGDGAAAERLKLVGAGADELHLIVMDNLNRASAAPIALGEICTLSQRIDE